MIVLARENAASDEIIAIGTLSALKSLVSTTESTDVILAIARIYASLCKNSSQRVISVVLFFFKFSTYKNLITLVTQVSKSVQRSAIRPHCQADRAQARERVHGGLANRAEHYFRDYGARKQAKAREKAGERSSHLLQRGACLHWRDFPVPFGDHQRSQLFGTRQR